jgi:hypothetical protein
MFDLLGQGFALILNVHSLLAILAGLILGIVVGALPGLSPRPVRRIPPRLLAEGGRGWPTAAAAAAPAAAVPPLRKRPGGHHRRRPERPRPREVGAASSSHWGCNSEDHTASPSTTYSGVSPQWAREVGCSAAALQPSWLSQVALEKVPSTAHLVG